MTQTHTSVSAEKRTESLISNKTGLDTAKNGKSQPGPSAPTGERRERDEQGNALAIQFELVAGAAMKRMLQANDVYGSPELRTIILNEMNGLIRFTVKRIGARDAGGDQAGNT